MTRWAIIETHPNYAVSDKGCIINLNSGKSLKHQRSKRGGYYPFVNLYKKGERKNRTVHGLVAKAFLGKRPAGYHIDHKDSNINNPALSNLEYLTVKENMAKRRPK
jgi:hypothetical protein